MTWRVVVTKLAEDELHETARWYDSRRPGLGDALLAKFELTVTQIQQVPESYERFNAPYHRAPLGKFPYFVAYRVLPDAVRILRVLPERSDPRALLHRIVDADDR